MGEKRLNRLYRVPLIYGVFSVLWILFSDRIAFAAAPDLEKAVLYSTVKGLVFVISSTLLIYFLLKSDESHKTKLMNEIIAVQRSFNLLFEDNPQPMWIYENKSLEIMAVNPEACRVYGYTADEFRKLKITDLRKDKDISILLKTLAEYKNGLRQSGPWEHIKKSGDSMMVSVISHPLRSAGFDSTLVSIIDLTEQQKTLNELDTAMQERDDFESFGYSASHDLKGHLRAIIGYSELLQSEYQENLDEEGMNFVRQISKAGVAMSEMLDDMMILTGINRKPLEIQPLNLSKIYADTFKALRIHEPDRKVIVNIKPKMIAEGDNGAVRLISQNLLQNAWKYTKSTKNAKIEAGSLTDKDGEVVFFVKDNGIGFEQSFSERIFEPFNRGQANSHFDGMGIGLSVVRRAVERHGGRVWAESEPGKGACFFFTLSQKAQSQEISTNK